MSWPVAFVIVGAIWAFAWVLVVAIRNLDRFGDRS